MVKKHWAYGGPRAHGARMVRGVSQAQNPDAAQTAQGPMVPARLGGLARRTGDMRIAAPVWPRKPSGTCGIPGAGGARRTHGPRAAYGYPKTHLEKKEMARVVPASAALA